MGVDTEVRACGARMIVDDAITHGEKIAETLPRLWRDWEDAPVESTGPPQRRPPSGELDYALSFQIQAASTASWVRF